MKQTILLLLFVALIFGGCASQTPNAEAIETTTKPVIAEPKPPLTDTTAEEAKEAFESEIQKAYQYRPTAETEYETTSVAFVQKLFSEEYTEILSTFTYTEEMKKALTLEQLESFKTTLDTQMGAFKSVFDINTSQQSGYNVVRLNTQFDMNKLTLTFSFDEKGHIAGFVTEAFAEKSVVQKNDFAIEKQVKFGEPGWQLNGVITVPAFAEPKAVVILVHGSGPNDRNETIGPNVPFEDIAVALAKNGIATFRYDKRTFTYGQKLKNDLTLTPDEEVVQDVIYASQYLRLETGLDTTHLFVLGHSLGGYLLPQIHDQIKGVDGYIFMNANARPLEALVTEQYQYIFNLDGILSETESDSLSKLNTEIDKLAKTNLEAQSDDTLILGAYKNYWLYLDNYNPLEKLTQISIPMLFTQGLRDYQVGLKDLEAWKAHVSIDQDATFLTFDSLNHLMMSGTEASSPEEYYLKKEVAPEFIDAVSNWIFEKSH
ncbi:DUF3887 domain-containing protein [Fusibacter sp. 3D3]|uniref:DUF3887 domain-containing protein n=1 Tax=Fusibacter sp. 3D3 TaxID=1048380 RepID=UPI000853D4FF|nr:DUF3887 domain-containing protein [Fusibacter sp. 3D3]GAU78615.1 hydrolase [Fusibacter sp. 3D3]